jgi:hypothetical protein
MTASATHALQSAAIGASTMNEHASFDGMTPDQAYFTPLPFRSAA